MTPRLLARLLQLREVRSASSSGFPPRQITHPATSRAASRAQSLVVATSRR